MNTIAYLIFIIITLYTFGFAITLWKEKQKPGAIAAAILSLLIVVLPYFILF